MIRANKDKDTNITGWWFRTFFIFPYIGNNHPIDNFFRGVETTNQINNRELRGLKRVMLRMQGFQGFQAGKGGTNFRLFVGCRSLKVHHAVHIWSVVPLSFCDWH